MKINALVLLILVSLNSFTASAGVYEFKKLYQDLGYPSPTYFGSSEEEIQDFETYTSKEDTFYKEINSYLRYFPAQYEWNGISPADAKIMVNRIDHIFERVPALPQDIILFRGVDLKFRASKSYKISDEFVEKGYVSTSTSFNVAEYFAIEIEDQPTTSKKAIFVYYLNAPNLKGLLIDETEAEILLKHGIKIKIMALENINIPYDFYLAQICVTACEEKIDVKSLEIWKSIFHERVDTRGQ